ncbi:hypothetical protein BG842_22505 [Haladaptatus sp. W1]|uniref:DUF4352 domain-containing protein n=1 Tax=Haladaptatus sp. W1 TaxID=1897478 RepID=UPI000849C686|nr:DUF4352 domain-containing protein [Haladaptatus sp. W1]ODR82230.1 hypothetical protein BG842_22505 [Haladaptatus sp. W1]
MEKRSLVGRRSFIASSAMAVLAGCASEGRDKTDPTTSSRDGTDWSKTGASTGAETGSVDGTEESGKTTTVPVGTVVKDDSLAMVVRAVKREEKRSEFREARNGHTFVVVRMAVKNTSGTHTDLDDFLHATLESGSGESYDPSFSSPRHPMKTGVLAPGEVVRGDVVFEVPKSAARLSLRFDFEAFSRFEFERITVSLAETADSVADLKQSLGDAVLSQGTEASRDGVSVVVHGIRTTKKLDEFIEADDGYVFVVPDIEITNDGDERLFVSTLLQMRAKTGTGLAYTADISASSALKRPVNENSDIEAGASHRGELAYQVETGTAPLRWVFNFLEAETAYKAFWNLR